MLNLLGSEVYNTYINYINAHEELHAYAQIEVACYIY